jgi:hypothetical protein
MAHSERARLTRQRTALLVAMLTALAVLLVPAGEARAEWYFTADGAKRVAKDYVSSHYANTYYSDLTASCRPQGRRGHDPRYKYHRWVCYWYDSSDGTSGAVLIVGSSGTGSYYGRVLLGARVR